MCENINTKKMCKEFIILNCEISIGNKGINNQEASQNIEKVGFLFVD